MPARWDWPLRRAARIVAAGGAGGFGATRLSSKVHASCLNTEISMPPKPLAGGSAETIKLVPYGCTKFRISMFPLTETGPAWVAELPESGTRREHK